MAVPRRSGVRGAIVRGTRPTAPRSTTPPDAQTDEDVADPQAPRSVIDYALQRRAALRQLFGGGGLSSEFCDADPYLLRAARFHGEPAGHPCPACRGPNLQHVRYAYGDDLGHISGGAFRSADLHRLAQAHGAFRVYVVEVCGRCSWNFLITRYTLGDGVARRPVPRPRDLMEP